LKYKFLLINSTIEEIQNANYIDSTETKPRPSAASQKSFEKLVSQFQKEFHNMIPMFEEVQKAASPMIEARKKLNPIIETYQGMEDIVGESFGALIEAIKSAEIYEIDWEKVSEELQEFDYTSRKLSTEGWAIPTYYLLEEDFSHLNYMNNLDDQELNEHLKSFYVSSDYKNLFYELNNLNNKVLEGFSSQVEKMENILKADMDNYTLCIPVLFTILDGMFMEFIRSVLSEFEEEPKNIYISKTSMESIKKHYQLNNEEEISLMKIVFTNTLEAITPKFNFTNFKKGHKYYSRHSVLHGAMVADDYPFIEFLKLVNVCSLFSTFLGE